MSGTEYNYDNEGQFFPYFILTIAAIVTLPTTYSWLKPSKELESTAPRIDTEYKPEDADLIAAVKGRRKRRERKTKRMLLSILGWAVMAFMVYLIVITATTVPKIWDPYDVLGISRSASEKQIKSHFRRLSLTQHPDKVKIDASKNETVEAANEHWVEITKAFKALTDEDVRRNYLEYGHPDGKQSFSMGIALPQFLIQEGSGKYVLLFYIGLLGMVLPYYAGKWWYGSQKKTKEGVLVNSAGILFQAYKEDADESTIIEAASGADEYKEVLSGDKAESGLSRIEQKVLSPGEHSPSEVGLAAKDVKALKDLDDAQRRKALGLIWAYLGRVDLEDPALNDEKYEIGPLALLLNEAFTVMALHFGGVGPVLASYRLSQSIIQAIPPNGSPLLQLPHFTPKVIAAIEGDSPRKHLTVQQLMSLPVAQRKSKIIGPGLLSDRQFQQAMLTAQKLPYLHVEKAFFKVHSERFVTPNSLVQFVIKARIIPPGSVNVPAINPQDLEDIDKSDLPSKSKNETEPSVPPLAHAPFFARDVSPHWHVFLGDAKQGKIAVPPFTFATFEKPAFDKDGEPTYAMQTLKMQFGAPPSEGRYTFQMQLVCDAFVGLDTRMDVVMDVESAEKAEEMGDGGDISEPDEDSLAGQMALMKGHKVKKVKEYDSDVSSGSNTEGDEEFDGSSETDTETDSDGE